MLWLNIHRIQFVAVLGLICWFTSYFIYFRPIIAAWRKKGEPHSWSVDLVSKQSGGKRRKRET
jgi:hypothetical protein